MTSLREEQHLILTYLLGISLNREQCQLASLISLKASVVTSFLIQWT